MWKMHTLCWYAIVSGEKSFIRNQLLMEMLIMHSAIQRVRVFAMFLFILINKYTFC